MRIEAKVRKNPDYIAATTYLAQIGLRYDVKAHQGKGHPFLLITLPLGDTMAFSIACTPKSWISQEAVVARLKRAITKAMAK